MGIGQLDGYRSLPPNLLLIPTEKLIMSVHNTTPPSNEHKLFAVYHGHTYGYTQWLVWSKTHPTQEELLTTLDIYFEPEKNEFIDIDEIAGIGVIN